ncbi:hypothetical protein GUJ93_ZPchr0007g3268 [Zizania palustris]|uniref:Uncharacterized protein n=1 Tax=Zizania palustris TaxID=103762 RepID=A0A8J5VQT8_ZIZPA|nr:hypothetical protein GUJ93_ZPchr0007g3268 [Zizania palustris]
MEWRRENLGAKEKGEQSQLSLISLLLKIPQLEAQQEVKRRRVRWQRRIGANYWGFASVLARWGCHLLDLGKIKRLGVCGIVCLVAIVRKGQRGWRS